MNEEIENPKKKPAKGRGKKKPQVTSRLEKGKNPMTEEKMLRKSLKVLISKKSCQLKLRRMTLHPRKRKETQKENIEQMPKLLVTKRARKDRSTQEI